MGGATIKIQNQLVSVILKFFWNNVVLISLYFSSWLSVLTDESHYTFTLLKLSTTSFFFDEILWILFQNDLKMRKKLLFHPATIQIQSYSATHHGFLPQHFQSHGNCWPCKWLKLPDSCKKSFQNSNDCLSGASCIFIPASSQVFSPFSNSFKNCGGCHMN